MQDRKAKGTHESDDVGVVEVGEKLELLDVH